VLRDGISTVRKFILAAVFKSPDYSRGYKNSCFKAFQWEVQQTKILTLGDQISHVICSYKVILDNPASFYSYKDILDNKTLFEIDFRSGTSIKIESLKIKY
jgi:hypothetical protein